MLDEIYGSIRGIVGLGVVLAVDDTGPAQLITAMAGDGVVRDKVEVMQIFGFASMPPANGSICLLFAVGSDPANIRALPIACPAARFGELSQGDAAVYASDGTRVHVKNGGDIEIWAKTVTMHAPSDLTIDGNVKVNGAITATGDVVGDGHSLTNHKHNDAQGGTTGPAIG